MAAFLNDKLKSIAEVCFEPVVTTAAEAENVCVKASADKECIGVIMWMHTFSPSKMWICKACGKCQGAIRHCSRILRCNGHFGHDARIYGI